MLIHRSQTLFEVHTFVEHPICYADHQQFWNFQHIWMRCTAIGSVTFQRIVSFCCTYHKPKSPPQKHKQPCTNHLITSTVSMRTFKDKLWKLSNRESRTNQFVIQDHITNSYVFTYCTSYYNVIFECVRLRITQSHVWRKHVHYQE